MMLPTRALHVLDDLLEVATDCRTRLDEIEGVLKDIRGQGQKRPAPRKRKGKRNGEV